jgi:hypothetical protein
MKKSDSGEGQLAKLFYFGKNLDQNFFTLLLKCIETDMNQSQIAKYLSKKYGKKVSKQRVFYWLRILLRHGLIVKDRGKPTLTDSGKKVLIHGEPLPNYSGHAFEVSYPLVSNGTLPKNNVKLKNWGYWKDRFYGIHIRVDRGKENRLVIYAPDIQANTKHDLLIKLGEKLGMILTLIERQYQCEVDWKQRKIIRRLEVHARNDPEGKVFEEEKINYKGNCIDINQSGHAHFDIIEGNRSLEPFEAIERYDQMIRDFPSMQKLMGKMIVDQKSILNLFAINTETLNQIKNAILSITKAFEGQGIIRQLQEENALNRKFDAKNEGFEGQGVIRQPQEENVKKVPQNANNEEIEGIDLVHLEILEEVPSFVAELQGVMRDYPDMYKGARIWLEQKVAKVLIDQGKARKLM